MNEKIKWEMPLHPQGTGISDGDIRIVNLPVKVIFEWSDEIVSDYDKETGHIDYTSGYIMKVLPEQGFVYENQDTNYLGNLIK